MKRIALYAIVALPLLGTAAFAQTTTPAPMSPAPSMNAPAAPSTMLPATPSTAMVKGPMLGTQLWKQGVYDTKENRIGEVDDVVIGENGQIQNVVVGVGGFLGIGEKAVSIPYGSLKPVMRNNQMWFVVDQTKEQLNAAPAFDKTTYKH